MNMSESRNFYRRTTAWRCGVALGLALCAVSVWAQSTRDEEDWKETEVPAPPAFQKNGLLRIDMPPYVTLTVGVDPATLSLSADGVVRYVVVAVNASGSVTALYEGIRCATDQVKSYARASEDGRWVMTKAPTWRGLSDNLPSKHALAFARQAACESRSIPVNSVADIIKNLKR